MPPEIVAVPVLPANEPRVVDAVLAEPLVILNTPVPLSPRIIPLELVQDPPEMVKVPVPLLLLPTVRAVVEATPPVFTVS